MGAILRTLLLAGCGAPGLAAQENPALGPWEGVLEHRGAEMAIRLEVSAGGDAPSATLDLPGLIMAWEPVPTTATDDGVEVELPFGLGVMPIEPEGDQVSARRMLGGEALTLSLRRSQPPPFTREEVGFPSHGARLAGLLVLPDGEGPHPGVVLIHGSAPQGLESWSYRSWADLLVREGLAVLLYDKRGVGRSEGDPDASLAQLADDAVAAASFLRARPEVDGRRVGFKGSSQGAWLAELAADELGDVAFLLLVSAAAGTPREQELQQIEHGMRADGLPERLIEDALAYAGLYFYVARTGNGWEELERAIERARVEPWGQYVDQPRSLDDLDWWRDNHDVQPASVAGELRMPVLLLYGGADWITPPVENAEELAGLFPDRSLVEVRVLDGADHRLERAAGPDAEGRWQWPRVAPEVPTIVSAWLEAHRLR
jgi:pimeloyl-ACP methyl ester carboxylesterase